MKTTIALSALSALLAGALAKENTGRMKCECKGDLDENIMLATAFACKDVGVVVGPYNIPLYTFCILLKDNQKKFEDECAAFSIGSSCVNINHY
ncbi:hypothetical protein GQ42DRAFT_164846 [Ramicandelaber brevisporus]|nr:hypothetical protein GQ42DRAFT_164846 [Ramicandelaber brevisporus]